MKVGPYLTKKIKDLQKDVDVMKRTVTKLKCMLKVALVVVAIMGAFLTRGTLM